MTSDAESESARGGGVSEGVTPPSARETLSGETADDENDGTKRMNGVRLVGCDATDCTATARESGERACGVVVVDT